MRNNIFTRYIRDVLLLSVITILSIAASAPEVRSQVAFPVEKTLQWNAQGASSPQRNKSWINPTFGYRDTVYVNLDDAYFLHPLYSTPSTTIAAYDTSAAGTAALAAATKDSVWAWSLTLVDLGGSSFPSNSDSNSVTVQALSTERTWSSVATLNVSSDGTSTLPLNFSVPRKYLMAGKYGTSSQVSSATSQMVLYRNRSRFRLIFYWRDGVGWADNTTAYKIVPRLGYIAQRDDKH